MLVEYLLSLTNTHTAAQSRRRRRRREENKSRPIKCSQYPPCQRRQLHQRRGVRRVGRTRCLRRRGQHCRVRCAPPLA